MTTRRGFLQSAIALALFGGDRRLICDAGTGLRVLGTALNGRKRVDAHLFLTHTHLDHICSPSFPTLRSS